MVNICFIINMKKALFISLLTITVLACGEAPEKTLIDEKYEPTDDELFEACADLKGIGQYIIGKSTFKSILKDKEFRHNTNSWDWKNNFFNGHWGNDFWRSSGSSVSNDTEKGNYIEENAKQIKQLALGMSFKVGELTFDKFDMAFLNDTLVAIWFFPDRNCNTGVINHYLEKYGNGRGKKYDFRLVSKNAKGEVTATRKTDEEHIWENEAVALEYIKKEMFHTEPGYKPSGSFTNTMLLYSKSRYSVFEQILMEYASKWDAKQKSVKEGVLNSM